MNAATLTRARRSSYTIRNQHGEAVGFELGYSATDAIETYLAGYRSFRFRPRRSELRAELRTHMVPASRIEVQA